MLIRRRAVLFAPLLLACAAPAPETAPPPAPVDVERSGPPIPYVDEGACPFEGCVYRDWIVKETVALRAEPADSAPVRFTVAQGATVRGVTGVVITTRPGKVVFRKAGWLQAWPDSVHGETGDTLYLLTYRGEGTSVGWFRGKKIDTVDGSGLLTDNCQATGASCVAELVRHAESVWWVRIEWGGKSGWTRETTKFGNMDRFGE